MAEITNFLNRPLHVYEVVNNAKAGGVVDPGATGANLATGGLAVATSSDNGRCTITYNAYSGTPAVVANGIASDSAQSNPTFVNPFGIGPSSAGLIFAAVTATNGNIATVSDGTAMVYVYGNRTGTGIS